MTAIRDHLLQLDVTVLLHQQIAERLGEVRRTALEQLLITAGGSASGYGCGNPISHPEATWRIRIL
ncbi:MAG: hypothetical protein QM702_20710 [Rubrivivax sp.]